MDRKAAALSVSGTFFFIFSIVHVVRLIFTTEVIVSGFLVPVWYSGVIAAICFVLSLWMFRSIK